MPMTDQSKLTEREAIIARAIRRFIDRFRHDTGITLDREPVSEALRECLEYDLKVRSR
jgi:hypothetical protein